MTERLEIVTLYSVGLYLNPSVLQALKLVSAIFYQIFIFPPNDSCLKTMKNILFHLKSTFRSRDIQIFVIFCLPFHTFQIQKDEWRLE